MGKSIGHGVKGIREHLLHNSEMHNLTNSNRKNVRKILSHSLSWPLSIAAVAHIVPMVALPKYLEKVPLTFSNWEKVRIKNIVLPEVQCPSHKQREECCWLNFQCPFTWYFSYLDILWRFSSKCSHNPFLLHSEVTGVQYMLLLSTFFLGST